MSTNGASSDGSEGDGNSNANVTSSAGQNDQNNQNAISEIPKLFNCAESCEHSYCEAKRDNSVVALCDNTRRTASRLITNAQYVEHEARKNSMVILYGLRKFYPLSGSLTLTI